MQALCQVHLLNNQLSPRQFFRSAYMWKFGKDATDLMLANDLLSYHTQGKIPAYVTDYLVHCYGAH